MMAKADDAFMRRVCRHYRGAVNAPPAAPTAPPIKAPVPALPPVAAPTAAPVPAPITPPVSARVDGRSPQAANPVAIPAINSDTTILRTITVVSDFFRRGINAGQPFPFPKPHQCPSFAAVRTPPTARSGPETVTAGLDLPAFVALGRN
jgi:peroxiredoxin